MTIATDTVSPPSPTLPAEQVRLSEVVAALSASLDMTMGQPVGHAVRSCYIGMRLAQRIGLDQTDRAALFYALLLKDLGCSTTASKVCYLFDANDNAVKRGLKSIDGTRILERVRLVLRHAAIGAPLLKRLGHICHLAVHSTRDIRQLTQMKCERGGNIALLFGMPEATAAAMHAQDEHWDGGGYPDGVRGVDIPLPGRIIGLAQTVEVFAAQGGAPAALEMARQRSGRWFDPKLVDALLSFEHDTQFWSDLEAENLRERISVFEPEDYVRLADGRLLDRLCYGFAQVVDAKSPWTRRHSEGVAQLAVGIGQALGFSLDQLRDLRRVGLLHDIGKLGVPNTILDKAGPLTDDELHQMRQHPRLSHQILRHVPCLNKLAEMAASHHERLDGRGYHRGLTGEMLNAPARALVVADMFEAMSADRPYRETMPREKVLAILNKDAGTAVCPQAVKALHHHLDRYGYDPNNPNAAAAA